MGTFTIAGNAKNRGIDNVNSDLRKILEATAASSPYNVTVFSGLRYGSARGSRHNTGNAVDIVLTDPTTGREIPNSKSSVGFPIYEAFAKKAREYQVANYPSLNNSFRWGGYFSGGKGVYGATDLMHFDIKPGAAMAGGTWDKGLYPKQAAIISKMGPGQIYSDRGITNGSITKYGNLWSNSPTATAAASSTSRPSWLGSTSAGASANLPLSAGAQLAAYNLPSKTNYTPVRNYTPVTLPKPSSPARAAMATNNVGGLWGTPETTGGIEAGAGINPPPVAVADAGVKAVVPKLAYADIPYSPPKVPFDAVMKKPSAMDRYRDNHPLVKAIHSAIHPSADAAPRSGFHPFGGLFANFHPFANLFHPASTNPVSMIGGGSSGGGYSGPINSFSHPEAYTMANGYNPFTYGDTGGFAPGTFSKKG